MMNERNLSLREDVESTKLQVPIPKDQELRNLTTSRYPMLNTKKQQHHQGRASAKGKARDGREPNSSRISGSSRWNPCPDEENYISDICRMCQKQLMEAAMKVTEVWVGN
jgi:hypothetical protein